MPRAFAAANELVAWKADVLFAFGPELALQAAAAARPPVPIVMGAANFDPIAKGYVQSLARPGGNVTGIISRWPELAAKQIEVLQEAFPDRNRLGVLWDTQSADQFSAAEREAKARRLELRSLKLENPPYDFAAAFRTLAQDDVQMLIVSSSPLFSPQNAQIASLAIEHRLPAMFILKHYVEAGGLMSYGVDFTPLMRRAASFVAKILRGAKPADLPVEQATHFEFVAQSEDRQGDGPHAADVNLVARRRGDRIGAPAASWCDPAGASPAQVKGSVRLVASVAWPLATVVAKRTQRLHGVWD